MLFLFDKGGVPEYYIEAMNFSDIQNYLILNIVQFILHCILYTANVHGPFMVSLWSDCDHFDLTKSCRNLGSRRLEPLVKFIWLIDQRIQILWSITHSLKKSCLYL